MRVRRALPPGNRVVAADECRQEQKREDSTDYFEREHLKSLLPTLFVASRAALTCAAEHLTGVH
jgi:hypothetical protein